MDLQTAFYIIGIVFMVVNLVLIIAILAAVLVIKAKIDHAHRVLNHRVNQVKDITGKASVVFRAISIFARR